MINESEQRVSRQLEVESQFLIKSYVLIRVLQQDSDLFMYIYNWYRTKNSRHELDAAGYFPVARKSIKDDLGFSDGIVRRGLKALESIGVLYTARESTTSVTKFKIDFDMLDRLLAQDKPVKGKKKSSKDQFYVDLSAAAKDWNKLQAVKDNLKPYQIQVLYTISKLAGNNPIEWSPSTLGHLNTKLKKHNISKKPIDFGFITTITLPRYVTAQATPIKYTQLLINTFFDHLSAFPERHPSERKSFEAMFTEI